MESGLGESRNLTSPRAAEPQLRLVTELRPRREIFFENLRDILLRRKPERVWTTSPPGKFWPDVFVPAGIPWGRMTESGILHVLTVALMVGLTLFLRSQQQHGIKLSQPTSVSHYDVSEYLPPIDTGSAPAPRPRKGHPLLAKQKIISLPPRPDNFEQTIISPVDVKLPANVPLPNIVAWTPVPAPPEANALRSRISLPQLPVSVIAPPTNARNLPQPQVPQLATHVIGPAPAEASLSPDRKLNIPDSVIGPPPSTDEAKLRTPRDIIAMTPAVIPPPPEANLSPNLGAMNVGKILPSVAAPKLQVVQQRAIRLPVGHGPIGHAGETAASGGAPSPVPTQRTLANGNLSGQLIALNLHPVNIPGHLAIPPGRRTGEFAAGPEGRPDSAGTPDIQAGGHGPGGNGTSSEGPGSGTNKGLPPGIVIGNAPGAPPPGSVVVAGTPQKTHTPRFSDHAKSILMAAARPPRVGELTPDIPTETSPSAPSRIEDRIFGGKRYYTLSLNTPNLSSAGGSWIIHFAQLVDDHLAGKITAPIATTTVDPAYPAQLMRDGIEGTVVLYAVIRKDGTVGDVRIIRGIQGSLDRNACAALSHWKFQPGTKNGHPVDLEAIVRIPYKADRLPF